ncbi:hypothetical protein CPB85DRAFT_1295583 [Mucidula mucida]|nr:hypothetical protein CPB85DRAFT_1295583 [Mucidula mucida]
MSSENAIILYDIPSTAPGNAWSPNVWKTRFCLNYKGIPHKTVWVEYPDIASTCKSLNVAPTFMRRNTGEPTYTVPFIVDPSTGRAISESFAIAKYLDATYSDTPRLVPEGTEALQAAYVVAWDSQTGGCTRFVVPKTFGILNEASQIFFRESRERIFGKKIEELLPHGDEAKEVWAQYEAGLGKIARCYPEKDIWAMGVSPSFADFVAGGEIYWIRLLLGTDSEEWKALVGWHGGRWGKLEEALRKYATVY